MKIRSNVYLDEELKENARRVFKEHGLSFSDGLNLLLREFLENSGRIGVHHKREGSEYSKKEVESEFHGVIEPVVKTDKESVDWNAIDINEEDVSLDIELDDDQIEELKILGEAR